MSYNYIFLKKKVRQPLAVYHRFCHRCGTIFCTKGKYSEICNHCRKKGWQGGKKVQCAG